MKTGVPAFASFCPFSPGHRVAVQPRFIFLQNLSQNAKADRLPRPKRAVRVAAVFALLGQLHKKIMQSPSAAEG